MALAVESTCYIVVLKCAHHRINLCLAVLSQHRVSVLVSLGTFALLIQYFRAAVSCLQATWGSSDVLL